MYLRVRCILIHRCYLCYTKHGNARFGTIILICIKLFVCFSIVPVFVLPFSARRVLRACLVLCPLLGVTWVFGVLSVTEPIGLASQYLFTICNSLQVTCMFVKGNLHRYNKLTLNCRK